MPSYGSYMDESVQQLRVLDIELTYGTRITDPKALDAYAQRRGRNFGSLMDRLYWPTKELLMILRDRSTAISITVHDIDQFTDRSRSVYSIADDPGAAPPPCGATRA